VSNVFILKFRGIWQPQRHSCWWRKGSRVTNINTWKKRTVQTRQSNQVCYLA